MEGKKSIVADLGLLLVAIIWGGSYIVTKNILDSVDPIYMTFLRFASSAIIMGVLFLKNMLKMNRKDLRAGSIIGFFMYFAFITQTIGLQYTTVSKQAFITASNVVMVPFILWAITKNRPDYFDIFAAVLCFLGIGILSMEGSMKINLGDGLTLICAVFFALHIISIGKFAKKHDPIVLSVVQFSVVAILSLVTCLIFGIELATINLEMTKSIGFMAVVSTIIAFGIQNVAQKYTSSTHAAIILSLESVFGVLFGVIFLNEAFTLRTFLGCLIIFIAIITAETKWSFLKP